MALLATLFDKLLRTFGEPGEECGGAVSDTFKNLQEILAHHDPSRITA